MFVRKLGTKSDVSYETYRTYLDTRPPEIVAKKASENTGSGGGGHGTRTTANFPGKKALLTQRDALSDARRFFAQLPSTSERCSTRFDRRLADSANLSPN